MTEGQIPTALIEHRWIVIVVVLIATAVVGSAADQVETTTSTGDFRANSPAAEDLEYVENNFRIDGENRTTVQVVIRGDNVLSKESLIESLRLQRAIRENETTGPTLVEDGPAFQGVGNVVALVGMRQAAMQTDSNGPPIGDGAAGGSNGQPVATELREWPDGQPLGDRPSVEGSQVAVNTTLEAQIEQLESMDEAVVDAIVRRLLSSADGTTNPALRFMPTDYEPGSGTATARVMLVFQQSAGSVEFNNADQELVDSQVAMREIVEDRYNDDGFIFGLGVVQAETGQAIGDSFTLIGPLALLLVLITLIVAYRDTVDIVLGMIGIGLVLTWTWGFMGWVGLEFNTILTAVPILLIGLSIDFAIHVFMRHREAREDQPGRSVSEGMIAGLAGVGVALVWVTVTTAIGFLSNVVSPIAPLQDFGLVSAVGIVSALIIFGGLIPAIKVAVDGALESRGFDRRNRSLGTAGGKLTTILSAGIAGAKRAPFTILLIALLLSSAGAYGATQVDTSFDRSDFLTRSPPDWMTELPKPFAPANYTVREQATFINDRFLIQRQESQAELLIRGNVTADGTLGRLGDVRNTTAEQSVTVELSDGEPRIEGPTSVIQQVAADHESFNATVTAADTDGDRIPDRNLERVYDELYRVAPDQAPSVVAKGPDGEYAALRMTVFVSGDALAGEVATQMRDAVAIADGDGLEATATGRPVLTAATQQQLLDSVVLTLIVTTLAVLAVLILGYRFLEGSATLGAITIVPVLFGLSWVLGSMWLLDIAFNAQTALITSLGIGLGVDYSVHVSERFKRELDDCGAVEPALTATVRGTGGALLGSAITTTSGFGVLAVAIVPSLQRFGIVIALAIVYAFVAAVLVLPSVLVLWARFFDLDQADDEFSTESSNPASGPR
ncbi:MAG: putative RND superfamily exporter protein [Halobacteriales archaeon]|jgi:predicted RND superfamily exporter protein